MNKTRFSFGIMFLLLCSRLAFAGGPLVLEGPTGNTPVTYENPSITLHVESGALGTLSNLEADAILKDAFNLWNAVNTSTINLIFDETLINLDINISNFDQYIPSLDGSVFNGDDGLNPIVYDSNGEIIDAFFGVGASDHTIGFAASIFTINSSFFNEGYAVFNGKELVSPLTVVERKLLIAHEIGHLFGLDHSQTNINNQETISGTPFICTSDLPGNYPVMYPFVCRNIESLHADEVSAISALYPITGINNNFGILQGHFVDETGNAILGANIWAENITTGKAVSIVSDYLKQGTGFYKLYLPPGNYTLHANSINTLFYEGSSIGPYALFPSDISFVAPHPIPEVTYQGATQGNAAIISIISNQTLVIDFSIDGTTAVISVDTDADGIIDNVDNCQLVPNQDQLDYDRDGLGDVCDQDDDNDSVDDDFDLFPFDPAESTDTDNDGIGNNADTDDDNDGVLDQFDDLPLDSTESIDTDADGVGNNADTDDDNDGVLDQDDAFPLDSTKSVAESSGSSGAVSLLGLTLFGLLGLARRKKA